MNVSKMNHAMFSFALMGGMLVGARPSVKLVKSPDRSERK